MIPYYHASPDIMVSIHALSFIDESSRHFCHLFGLDRGLLRLCKDIDTTHPS